MNTQSDALLNVRNLVKNFELRANSGLRKTKRIVQAVANVSFDVKVGQTLGLVGESGSGKTTVGRSVLQLIQPTSGEVIFEGQDLTKMSFEQLRDVRRQMQIVFQDPFASLDPKMTVGSSIAEPLVVQGVAGNHQDKVAELLDLVGLAADHAKRFPHEFSGGQRQRVAIARALALKPALILLDEVTAALDPELVRDVLDVIRDLAGEGITMLLVSHEMGFIREAADRVVMMDAGRVVEVGPPQQIFDTPIEERTRAFMSKIIRH